MTARSEHPFTYYRQFPKIMISPITEVMADSFAQG
jgi:hypothetical protein